MARFVPHEPDRCVFGAAEAAPWLVLASQRDQAVFPFGGVIVKSGVQAGFMRRLYPGVKA